MTGMDLGEDEILARQLAAVASSVGAAGGLTGRVARRMKKNVHEIDLVLPLPFAEALGRVVRVLDQAGPRFDLTVPGTQLRTDARTVRVVTGGGLGGMNPVVVTALVEALPGGEGCAVKMRAAAKEGLIKQRAGEKTAKRLAALLLG
ncbi:hypothetical protein [Streptomyces sp. NBC_00306]|uniref:hypothetical protein n=1 Tax=Streptomyces sp. NBC_00306 TaxID=2975708 RepID=UPI002E290305|nr:hypothetical protein [Streptomyces sp. NBC_00306]